jgi:hypothetical protein
MIFLYLFYNLLAFFCVYSYDKCLPLQSDRDSCLVCLANYYEQQFLVELKLSLTKKESFLQDECRIKGLEKLTRKILILGNNIIDKNDSSYQNYDTVYSDLPEAFVNETKKMIT